MCGSTFMMYSPSKKIISLKTPCAAGCCGPKFNCKSLVEFNFLFFQIKERNPNKSLLGAGFTFNDVGTLKISLLVLIRKKSPKARP